MRDFIFHNPVKIYFGKGQARHIAQEVERVEGAVLVVYGGGSIKRNGAYDDVMAALAGTGHKIIELPGVTPNPRLDKALEGVRLVKEHGVGLILAVGGGSVIDCAKFISLGSGIGDDEDFHCVLSAVLRNRWRCPGKRTALRRTIRREAL